MVRDPHCSISNCLGEEDWEMDFRRSLSTTEYNNWIELVNSLQGANPEGEDPHTVLWELEPKKSFSAKLLYRFITNGGCLAGWLASFGRVKNSSKNQIFSLASVLQQLQVSGNLIKRGWKGNKECCLCNCVESVNHLLFECHLAKLV